MAKQTGNNNMTITYLNATNDPIGFKLTGGGKVYASGTISGQASGSAVVSGVPKYRFKVILGNDIETQTIDGNSQVTLAIFVEPSP